MAITQSTFAVQADGTNPGFFTTITADSIRGAVDNATFLTTATGAANGTIQSDYTVNATTGKLDVRDVIFTLPTGGVIATYYGSEFTNPLLNPTLDANYKAPNPGYAITQYTYSSPGVIAQIVAYDSTGRAYIGV